MGSMEEGLALLASSMTKQPSLLDEQDEVSNGLSSPSSPTFMSSWDAVGTSEMVLLLLVLVVVLLLIMLLLLLLLFELLLSLLLERIELLKFSETKLIRSKLTFVLLLLLVVVLLVVTSPLLLL